MNPSAPLGAEDMLRAGEHLFSEGRLDEAISCFENVLAGDPSNAEAWNNLGVIAARLDDVETAERLFTKALRLNRRDHDALQNLADLYNRRGESERAEALLAPRADIPPYSRCAGAPMLPPKRILVITNLFPPQELGGYGRMVADYVDILRKRRHSLHVLTSDSRTLGEPGFESDVERSLHLFGEWSGKGMKEYDRERILPIVRANNSVIGSAMDRFQPDICLVGNIDLLSAMVFQPVIARGIPVLHCLGNETVGYPPSDTPESPLFHVATPSEWLKKDAFRRGYPFQHAYVICPGAFVGEFAMPLPPATDELRIAYASLLNGFKGPQVLLSALQMLDQRGVPFSCCLAGGTFDPEFVDRLRAAAREWGLEKRVTFTGWLDREGLKDLYARTNVLVFPSLVNETFGISQVEALSAGLLVITSGGGGAKEVVEDGITGLWFRPGDHAQLARRLTELLEDRPRWGQIAAAGRQRAMRQFDIERSVDRLESAFGEMLGVATGTRAYDLSAKGRRSGP